MPIMSEESPRSMLSEMRKKLKGDNAIQDVMSEIEICDIYGFLDSADAKTRKNAALLIGELKKASREMERNGEDTTYEGDFIDLSEASEQLISHYEKEETLFVRPSYLEALSEFSISDNENMIEVLKNEEKKLSTLEFKEDEAKHKSKELHELKLIFSKNADKSRHEFKDFIRPFEVLLTCEDSIKEEVKELTYSDCKIVRSGVRTRVSDYRNLQKIRTYKEALFLVPIKRGYVPNRDNLGQIAEKTGLINMVDDLFNQTETQGSETYRFRLESRSEDPELKSGEYLKRISALIEKESKGRLINEAGDYEFTVVFRDGQKSNLSLYVLLPSRYDKRFAYRKNSEPTSMNPVTAATAISLIKSYMSEESQIIDPLCGTGTLLIERALAMPAKEYYGTDTYGQAVKEARENAMYAGAYNINFINRNFFDFKHDYPFQEILTEFPDLFGKEDVEKNNFCKMFFNKAVEISDEEATLFLITNEEGLIRKHIRLSGSMKLLRTINLKKSTNIYVIKIRKTGND